MKASKIVLTVLAGLINLFLLGAAQAQDASYSYQVLIDSDENSSTGCAVMPTGGAPVSGFEHRLLASVEVAGGTATVAAVEQQDCVGSSFSAPFAVTLPAAPPWPVALEAGVSAGDAVELAVLSDAVSAGQGRRIQLVFVADDGNGSDVLATSDGSASGEGLFVFISFSPVTVPTLSWWGLLLLLTVLLATAWLAHRRMGRLAVVSTLMLVAGVAWAMHLLPDGDLSDWSGTLPLGQDPGGDATNAASGNDLVAGFAAYEEGMLFFRIDVADLENQAPEAFDDAFGVDEDNALNEAAPGVLGNDTDANLDSLTATLATGPTSAQSFTLNADGSFDYMPNPDFNGTDSFTYMASDGQASSATATVTITVNPVNDAPSFSVGADQSVLEDSGQSVVAGFIADASAGPANEAGQALIFAVTNDNNGLFGVQPAIDETGQLTFTPAADANGSSIVTVSLSDDGGAANGGVDTSASANFTISINSVNDAPSFIAGPDVTIGSAGPPPGTVDLQVATTVNDAWPGEGDTIVLSVQIDNLSLTDVATNVTVTDDTSTLTGLTYVSDNSATLLDSASNPTSYNSGTGDWQIGALGASESLTLEIAFTVNGGTSGQQFSLDAIITAVDQPDANPANDSDTFAMAVDGVDIDVVKTADNPGPFTGDDVTYTVTVTNNSTNQATGLMINENLPLDNVNLTFVSANASGGTFTPNNPAPSVWDIGTLLAGQSETLQLTVTVNTVAGSILNTASVGALDQTDSDTGNNSDQNTIRIGGVADLSVSSTVNDAAPLIGDIVTYTLVVQNAGPDAADNVELEAPLPDGVVYASHTITSAQSSFNPATGSWSLNSVGAGQSVTLTIDAEVVDPDLRLVTSVEVIASDQMDPDSTPGNGANDEDDYAESAEPLAPQTVSGWAQSINPGAANETSDVLNFVTLSNTAPEIFAELPTIDPATGDLSFTPLNVNRTAVLTVQLQDDGGTANGGINQSAPAQFDITIESVVTAFDDAVGVTNGGSDSFNVLNNDSGPGLTAVSFGDSVANAGTVPADGTTILSFATGGGTLDFTLDAGGQLDVFANGTIGTGSVSIHYQVQSSNGSSDIGRVDVTYGDRPTAVDDNESTLGAGNEYSTDTGVDLIIGAGTGMLNNDTLGTPAATLAQWGGGDASAAVDLTPGSSRPFAGGTLTVNADGSFSLVQPTASGIFGFDYIVANTIGSSQASVEIMVDGDDLAVTKVVDQPAPSENDTVIYRVTLENVGTRLAENIVVTDDLSVLDGVTYISDNSAALLDSNSNPTSYSGGTGDWTVGALDAGQSLTLEISATVDGGASALPQPRVNLALLTASNPPDQNPANDSDEAAIVVQ